MTNELLNKLETYQKATGEEAPMFVSFGNIYEKDYIAWLDKAISRKKAFTEEEIDEFLKNKKFDIANDDNEEFKKGFKKGLK